MKIPVQNLYYLLCYAWDRVEEGALVDVASLKGDRPEDLFAHVLITGVSRALKRGLDRGYIEHAEDSRRPRGRMDVSETLKRALLAQTRIHCRYDEFEHDTLQNRILKATMRRLLQVESLDPSLRQPLSELVRRLWDVSDVPIRPNDFRKIQLHRNNAHYSLLLHVCEVVLRHLMIRADTGRLSFYDFMTSDAGMGTLFEAFVRNFLRREQSHFRVSRDSMNWGGLGDPADVRWLPHLETDITLRAPGQTIVIETKFTQSTYQERFEKRRIRSEHLNQLYAYLRNLERRGGSDESAAGILLYAKADLELDVSFEIHGHRVRVLTLDLDQSWSRIRSHLLDLVASEESEARAA